jgi:hypothetical protein
VASYLVHAVGARAAGTTHPDDSTRPSTTTPEGSPA